MLGNGICVALFNVLRYKEKQFIESDFSFVVHKNVRISHGLFKLIK